MRVEPLASCNTQSDKLACFKQTARDDVDTIRQFQQQVAAIDFPSDVKGKVTAMKAAVQKFVDDLDAIAGASSLGDLNTAITSIDLAGDGQSFDDNVKALGKALDDES